MASEPVRAPADNPEDWRDAWGSETDIVQAGRGAASSAIENSLDAFPSEETDAPPGPPARVLGEYEPLPPPRIAFTDRMPRSVFAVGTAALVLIGMVAVGFRSAPRPASSGPIEALTPDSDTPTAPADPDALAPDSETELSGTAVRVSSTTRAATASGPAVRDSPARSSGGPRTSLAPAPRVSAASSGRAADVVANLDAKPLAPVPSPRMSLAPPSTSEAPNAAPTGAAALSPPAPAPPASGAATSLVVAPPPAVAPLAEVARPAAPAPPTDRQVIQGILGQYEAAFSQLDTAGARAVWPGVDAGALERAFSQLERQALRFNTCSIAIIGTGATARCQGTTTYVPRVGRPGERTDSRRWQFELKKTGDRWAIVSVDSRE